jgi:hypothetical protein
VHYWVLWAWLEQPSQPPNLDWQLSSFFPGLAVVWAAGSVRPVNVRADAGLVSPNRLNADCNPDDVRMSVEQSAAAYAFNQG